MSLRNDVRKAGDLALMKAANEILQRSNQNTCIGDPDLDPDPSVSLKDVGEVVHVEPGVVMIRYPGPYAARQHEDRSMQHPRGGGPQFLGDALKSELPRLQRIVAGEVRAAVKRGH